MVCARRPAHGSRRGVDALANGTRGGGRARAHGPLCVPMTVIGLWLAPQRSVQPLIGLEADVRVANPGMSDAGQGAILAAGYPRALYSPWPRVARKFSEGVVVVPAVVAVVKNKRDGRHSRGCSRIVVVEVAPNVVLIIVVVVVNVVVVVVVVVLFF